VSRSESEFSMDDLLGARFARGRMLASVRVQEILRLASLTDLSGLRLPPNKIHSEAKTPLFYRFDWYTGRGRGKGGSPRETSPWGRFGYLGLRRRRRRSGSDVSLAGYWIVRICQVATCQTN
jgi:hypothetical protein